MPTAAPAGSEQPLEHYTVGNFTLQSGTVMPEAVIAYRALGTLSPDGRNAVLVTHGYTSGPRMVEAGGTTAEGGWSELVGPGKPVDTDRYFVVCPNMLGSSFGSSNAASRDPATGRPFGAKFPAITLTDIVTQQRALLEHLGVKHLVAVAGPSYGGFQAFQWAVTFPDFMSGIVAVVTSPSATPAQAQGNLLRLNALFAQNPNWNGGDYYNSSGGMVETMTDLRVATLKNYGIEAKLEATHPDAAAREAAIRELASRWANEFDANSMLILAKAMGGFNVEAEFAAIKAKVLYVLSRTDRLFPPTLAPRVMTDLIAAGVDAKYVEIDSEFGHIASGLDAAKWAPELRRFMARLSQA